MLEMNALVRRIVSAALALAVVAAAAAALAAPAGAALVSSPDGLWSWARPVPLGYPAGGSLSALEFGTPNVLAAPAPGSLFVATTVSDLLTTTDGGASWGWSPTGAVSGFAQPQSVDFVSPAEGWTSGTDTSGQNGVLLHTTDGGAAWRSALTLPGAHLTAVHFSDASSGWVLGGDDAEMLGWGASSTTDGGQTWTTPTALPLDSVANIDYSVFEAFAPQGGASAVFMETDALVGGTGDATTVWRTTDGGAAWTVAGKLPDAGISDAAFSSPAVGWATGAWLWRTVDGGASWHKVRQAPLAGRIVVVGNDVWVIGPRGSLHSSDGGGAWTSSKVSGNAADFADAPHGWVASGADYQRTTNGGVAWSHLTNAPLPGIGSLSAVAGGTVWGAAGRVVVSPDAGLHWRVTSRRLVNAVAAVSARQAWAVTSAGAIVHTVDGGHHWTVQTSRVSTPLKSVAFVDTRHGWVGGAGGVILRTTDGGRHWIYTREKKGGSINQLSFADADHGVAGGNGNNAFLVTRTGGRTWSLKGLPPSYRPTTFLMEDAAHGLIISVGAGNPQPQCFSTSDGGATWQLKASIPSGAFGGGFYLSLAGFTAQLCAVSSYGVVATSSDGGATWVNEGVVMGPSMRSVQFVNGDQLMISGSLGVMTRDLVAAPLP
jgi:photosystem II stability/assembly factor-like uncharacterized protein